MLIKVTSILLVTIYLAKALPVENEKPKPFVVDIPAVAPPSEDDEPQLAVSGTDDKIPVVDGTKTEDKPISSDSDVELVPNSDETTDVKPTFVIIRTRPFFATFPTNSWFSSSSSGSSPFGGFFQSPFAVNRDRDQTGSESDDSSAETVGPFRPFYRPSVFNIDDMMTRVNQQVSNIWGSLLGPNNRRPMRPLFPSSFNPFNSGEENNNTSSDEEIYNLDKFPANYTNSTSETKVIDGNVVQVNRTIHKISSGNNTRGFFQFQVINVLPKTSTEKAEPTPGLVDDDEEPLHNAGSGDSGVAHESSPSTESSSTEIPSTSTPVAREADPSLNEVGEEKQKGVDNGLL